MAGQNGIDVRYLFAYVQTNVHTFGPVLAEAGKSDIPNLLCQGQAEAAAGGISGNYDAPSSRHFK